MLNKVKIGIYSNAYGQIVNTIIQFAGAALFVAHWGVDEYGKWLLIYTIPAYIAMLDFGLMSTLSNKVVMMKAAGDFADINKIISTSFFYCISIALFALISGTLSVYILSELNVIMEDGVLIACILLVILSAVLFFNSFFDLVYRYKDEYAYGTFVLGTGRLLEWGGGALALIIEGNYIAVALGMLMVRLIFSVFIYYDSMRGANIIIKKKFISGQVLKNDIRPALTFMLFPVSNAISIQGVLPIINMVAGSAAVVVFSCTRTVIRVVTQLLTMVNRAYWTEFSKKFGAKDYCALKILEEEAQKKNIIFAAVGGTLVVICGEILFNLWLSNEVLYDKNLMLIMTISAVATSLWQVKWVVLMSTNNHSVFAKINFVLSILFVIGVYFLTQLYGVHGSAAAMVLYEISLLLFVRSAYRDIFHEK